ncbi:MAG: phytanoyl-CoA dioxygenase family protein [Chloroflexota bacterium]|nr:phytanoyl-CoA dioxygenase family protein [Chloroflexota bacterium]MDE2945699.1 phytanoyl-CoA dioxygenase family protein [Chloroflexota bacterium]
MTRISEEQIEQYQREGYFILESVIPERVVDALQDECMRIIDIYDKEMEAKGLKTLRINHYKKRYFVANRSPGSPVMTEFLFGDLMADICRATLGDEAYLYNEQYVVKAADTDTRFAWHQDSGYVGHYHRAFLSCWCALDDMSLENGTIYILPYSRDGRPDIDDISDHPEEAGSNDKVGYHGDDPGDPAIVPKGSIVVFSSRTFHRSGANMTDAYRRSYLAQYSTEPIMTKDGSQVLVRAEPLLKNGVRVNPAMAAAASWAPLMSGGRAGKGPGAD